jgi:hypothetical protein
MYMIIFPVALDQPGAKVATDFGKDRPQGVMGILREDLAAILCNKHQVDV